MPPVVGFIASAIVALGAATPLVSVLGIGGLAVAGSVIGTVAVGAALTIGASYLSQSLIDQPQGTTPGSVPTPKPSDGQLNIRQAVPDHRRHYGRVRTGGPIVFYESKDGYMHVCVETGLGEIDAIEAYFLNEAEVTLDGSGFVQEAQFIVGGTSRVQIETSLGADNVASSTILQNAFTEWTADHRGRGIAWAVMRCQDTPAEQFRSVYESGKEPNYSQLERGAKLYDPRKDSTAGGSGSHRQDDPSTFEWSDNAALIIADYLAHPDGYGMGWDAIDWTAVAAEADVCDELVTDQATQQIARWRIWGTYTLAESRRDVLRRLLAAADAMIYQTAGGLVAFHVGRWQAPAFTLTDDHIRAVDLQRYPDATEQANEIKVLYTDPDLGYREAESNGYRDDAAITALGRTISRQANLYMVPHHNQAVRLAKRLETAGSAEWRGQLTLNLYGLNLIGQRFVHVEYSELGIDEDFEIQKLSISGDGLSVTIEIVSASAADFAFDAATEEGTPPTVPVDTSSTASIAVPTNLAAAAGEVALSGGVGVALFASWDPPSRDSLSHQARFRQVDTTSWTTMSVVQDEDRAFSGFVDAGPQYEIQVRAISLTGLASAWSASATVTATVDTSAPATPTSFGSSLSGSDVTLTWTASVSANQYASNVYRNTVDNFGTATQIATVYGGPSDAETYADEGLSAGTYYYWITGVNASQVESTETASQTQTVV